jgi:hypothetical protein
MYRHNMWFPYDNGGLWFAFVSAAAAGSLVAFFIAP